MPPKTASLPKPQLTCLTAIAQFGYLTAHQLARLCFGRSGGFVRGHLKQLVDNGLVSLLYLQQATDKPGGKPRRVYLLSRKGISVLKRLGLKAKSVPTLKSQSVLKHAIASSELLILCHRLIKQNQAYSVTEFKPEIAFRREPLRIGETQFVPDAYAVIETVEERYPIYWEWDESSEGEDFIRRKVEKVASYAKAQGATVCFVSVESRRIQRMINWTERHLTTKRAESAAPYLFFAAFDPEEADPVQVFTQPMWRIPFNEERQVLLGE